MLYSSGLLDYTVCYYKEQKLSSFIMHIGKEKTLVSVSECGIPDCVTVEDSAFDL